jgi:hypothetical protein
MPTPSIPFVNAINAYRQEGNGNSGWIALPKTDAPAALHLFSGNGHWETCGNKIEDVDAGFPPAVTNPDVAIAAPDSRKLYPLPTAVQYVGTGNWAIQINVAKGR